MELRDRLITELNELDSGDNAALWAYRSLARKNRLTTTDVQLVEDSFKTKLESSDNRGGGAPRKFGAFRCGKRA